MGVEKAILVEHISTLFFLQKRWRPLPFSKFLKTDVVYGLTFWNTHLYLAFHNTQAAKEDIVDQTLSTSRQWIVVV